MADRSRVHVLCARLALACPLLLAACGGGGSDTPGPATAGLPLPTVDVDASLQPFAVSVAGIDGAAPRPLARVTDAHGHTADFVADELLLQTDDAAALDALLARHGGRVVKTIDFARAGIEGVPRLHLVRIERAAPADAARLAEDLRVIDPASRGDHRVSSDAALNLLAAGAAEGAAGRSVSLNWVLRHDSIVEGATNEAPAASDSASYRDDAFEWTYMDRGSAQDIGVADAWRALAAARKLGNRVKIMVLDAGFTADHADFPDARRIFGVDGWNTRNPYTCSGSSACPWHGTSVAIAAMGRPDNAFGSAGPAGPIGELIAVQSPSPDLFEYIGYAVEALAALTSERPRIVNISASASIPAGVAWFADSILGTFTGALRSTGTLVFASAGNDGNDVDSQDCVIFCWEDSMIFPCESAGVLCVGGMGANRTARAAGSNFGSKTESASVDFYGPFFVWDGPNPDDPDNLVTGRQGTSFSSPFVAGVAALVIAADPGLSADRVQAILRDTAHVGGVHDRGGSQLRVNAFAAVRSALGGSVPPFVRIDRPLADAEVAWRQPLPLQALAWDLDSEVPSVHWRSDRAGELGSGDRLNATFSELSAVGTHTLTASAISRGQGANDSVRIVVRNDAPAIRLLQPNAAGRYCAGEAVDFRAEVDDPNNPPAFPFPAAGVAWRLSGPSGSFNFPGPAIRLIFSTAGSYTLAATATDELGLSDTRSVALAVRAAPCDAAPVVEITNPAEAGEPDLVLDANESDALGAFARVTLRGRASDREDGALSGAALRWTTTRNDLQPPDMGSGEAITVRLYIGCTPPPVVRLGEDFDEHTITLTAHDSAGNESSDVRRIRVRLLC